MTAIPKCPIPKRLKEARLSKGFSQKGLGIAAGIDEFSASARMNQYETGKHIPDFLILSKIAKNLDLPTAYFYAEENTLANLLSLYSNLSTPDRQALIKWCEKRQS